MNSLVTTLYLVLLLCSITDLRGSQNQATGRCEQNTVELSNLLSFACSMVGNTNNCRRSFLQAVRANNNQPSISLLSLYADAYFADTQYNECVNIIDNATPTLSGPCIGGYCAFIRCIRRINSDKLIAGCYLAATRANQAEEEVDQIILYKNITSCILAIARCSTINPITGQRQTNSFTTTSYDKLGKPTYISVPLYNTLQINQAGDLRVIAFPGTTTIQRYYLCPYEFNLRETSWLDFNC